MAPPGAGSLIGKVTGTYHPSLGEGGKLPPVFIATVLLYFVTLLSCSTCNMEPDCQFPIASINCNSLNMSSIGNMNHLLKIYGITSLKSDIVLLSDIRLCNSAGGNNLSELKTSFRINPHCSYHFYYNSSKNKRGVGILIKHSLVFTVLGEARDPEENFLALHLETEGKRFVICSIYGPNQVQPAFFTALKESISNFGDILVVIGGDWNCTISCDPSPPNTDVLNMQNPPNLRHSNLLKKMCNEMHLSDPFRVKFPFRKEFTYFSKDTTKKNKSRIDFFIVSNTILSKINKSFIQPHMQNKMFDHRAIFICCKDPPKVIKQPTISRDLIKDPDIELHVSLAVADTYLIHSNALDEQEAARLTTEVGIAKRDIRRAGPDKKYFHDGYRSEEEENARAALFGNIHELLDSFPINTVQRGGFKEGLKDDIFWKP
jgi:exonuclease III